MKNLSLLDEIIVGRVKPHIYAFSTNSIPNYLKVGDTYRAVSKRMDEWRRHFPNLKEEFQEKALVNEELFFRDYSVHQYLEKELGRKRLCPENISQEIYFSKEFFKDTTTKDVQQALEDIILNYEKGTGKYQYYRADTHLPEIHVYSSSGSWTPRPNQQEAVNRFKEAVKNGRSNLLMYAVMRFGKSFTAMLCAKEINAKLVLIVSAKADVRDEWRKTVQSADNFNNQYTFVSSDELLHSTTVIEDTLKKEKGIVIFLTLQDLQGDDIKEKHKEIFSNYVDLLIVDETHYGARAEKYGQILRRNNEDEDVKDKLANEDYIDINEAENQLKVLNSKIKLHLSGTPYRILMGSEFTKEDIIAFCQFSDIVREQESWDAQHLLSDEYQEWDNPYFGFPQMIRFAFYPSKSAQQKLAELKKSGQTYAFSALLKPKSIKKDNKENKHKYFVFENEVLELLEVIDGSKQDENVLSFLNYNKIKEGNMCRHIVMVLPYCASCDAMEELLNKNANIFKNLNQYRIINISGLESASTYKSIQDIKNCIKKSEEQKLKTITLTVNRMLTGSTVEEWDTMIYLKDTSSPQEYDQAIFRLQNQYIKVMKDNNGEEIKINMKPQTLLVDFDPHRMFVMQEQKSLIYNANIEIEGNYRLKERISEELRISPIITLNKDRIEKVQPTDILKALSEYSSNRGVFDETRDIPIDFSLLKIKEIKNIIEMQSEIGSSKGFETEAAKGNGEGQDLEQDSAEENTIETNSPSAGEYDRKDNNNDNALNKEDIDKKSLEKKFRTYYSRILFYSFLTKTRVQSLEEIIKSLNQIDNERIAKNLNLDKDIIYLILSNMNAFILSQLDYKIQNINTLANDEKVSPIERAKTAIRKFDRLSSSEVATPSYITREMISMIPKKAFTSLVKKNHVIMDISSKTGEFAIAIYDRCKEIGIDINKIRNCILSIPTSSVAYEFTKKIYDVLGLNTDKIASKFNTYDLLKVVDRNTNETDYQKIRLLLAQNKKFCDIDLTGSIERKIMKFNAIVGNPPYQENIGSETNRSLSKQLFPIFIIMAASIKPDYLSLITPSRWFTGNAQDKSFVMLREYMKANNHFSKIINYLNSSDIFKEVSVPGGVNYFLYPKNYTGDIEFTEITENTHTIVNRPLFEDGLDVILPMNNMISILRKVSSKKFISMEKIVSGRNPFGIPATADELSKVTSKEADKSHSIKVLCAYEEIKYIAKDSITRNKELVNKWKVFTSKMNGGAGTLLDNKTVAILGKTFVMGKNTICSNTHLAIGKFDSEVEAINLNKYMNTRFFRFMLGIKKISQVLTSNIYSFVPEQDFTSKSDIDWKQSLEDIDKQLYKKYSLSKEEITYINKKIKAVEDVSLET